MSTIPSPRSRQPGRVEDRPAATPDRDLNVTPQNIVRCVLMQPYSSTVAPWFILTLFDVQREPHGRCQLCYQLVEYRRRDGLPPVREVIFKDDGLVLSFGTTPDSERAIAEVMGWLTLQPGDTDAEFFRHYTPRQLAFCEADAEDLGNYVLAHYGDDHHT